MKHNKSLSLVEKYDISLTFLFGIINVDKIAEAKDYDDVVRQTQKLMLKRWVK